MQQRHYYKRHDVIQNGRRDQAKSRRTSSDDKV